ncbi:MAG: ABC transporter substrate-binding protein [Deltaproteobacteria bacterium]|nr:ABC transporter substrate-binding protein [Deltaproteobacteria bacterium]
MRWFFLFFAITTAFAEDKGPTQTIEALVSVISKNIVADQQMKDAVSQDKALFQEYRKTNQKFHEQIAQFIDFEKLGTDSMPKKWRDKYWVVKASERKKFLELLQELVQGIVYPRAREFFKDVKFTYKKPTFLEGGQEKAKRADVLCKVRVKDQEVNLRYRLIRRGNQWKIYDVNLEGEWWTDSLKSQFNHVITTKSYDELISLMQKKLKNVQEGMSF